MTAQPLPPEAFAGLLGDYVETVTPTTEAPSEFHLMAFATVLGLVFADVRVEMGTFDIRPTLFTLLVGPTGQARKTTVNNSALAMLDRIAPEVPSIEGEGSAQGLLAALIRAAQPGPGLGGTSTATMVALQEGRLNGLPDNGASYAVGVPTLVKVHEFTKLLRQASRSGTADLTETYLRLFDHPERLENNSIRSPMVLLDPCVAVLGDSTEEHLADLFGESNVSNGFLNRLTIAQGAYRGDPLPIPPRPDADRLDAIVEGAKAARDAIEPGAVVDFDPEAAGFYDTLYRETLYPRMTQEAISREGTHLIRLATLYALQEGRTTIDLADIEAGWTVAEYLSASALSVAGKVGAGDRAKALAYLLDRIDSQGLAGVRCARDARGKLAVGYLGRLISPSRRGSISAFGLQNLAEQLLADAEAALLEPRQLLVLGVESAHPALVARSAVDAARAEAAK